MGKGSEREHGRTVLDVEEGDEDREQAGHSHLAHELPVTVVRAQRQRAFPQVSQALCGTMHKRVSRDTKVKAVKR